MINFSTTLDVKSIIADKNGNAIVDFTEQTLVSNEFNYTDIIVCPDEFKMRGDLISELKLGTVDKLDILLKSNDISNPFIIDVGDVILIPDNLRFLENFTTTLSSDMAHEVRKQYVDTNKKNILNTGDSLKSFEEREKTKLPPNYSKTGDKEMIISNGKVTLGPNITQAEEDIEIPFAKQEAINRIKKIING